MAQQKVFVGTPVGKSELPTGQVTGSRKKVFVGMSGGVDSSVSAALLKEAGFDVTGVFIEVWHPDFLACSEIDDRREAMRAAAHLDIPFQTLVLKEEYKTGIVDYMIREYRAGRTPNPDVLCNKTIKFGGFFNRARAAGADFIATGHYARVEASADDPNIFKLYAGVDPEKDQSYFLWMLTQNELSRSKFPVGGFLKKDEVRALAKKFKLPNALRKDSQGLCFMGKVDIKEFLEHYIPADRGAVLNESGEEVGWHDGSFYFTLGQRHGFTITKKTPDDPPMYVITKDITANTITVSSREVQEAHGKRDVAIEHVNFISGSEPDLSRKYSARVRYRQALDGCVIARDPQDEHKYVVTFDNPQRSASPGQSLVIYDLPRQGDSKAGGDECVGGGIII